MFEPTTTKKVSSLNRYYWYSRAHFQR